MNTATLTEVDEIINKETHQGDTFAEVEIDGERGWVRLEE